MSSATEPAKEAGASGIKKKAKLVIALGVVFALVLLGGGIWLGGLRLSPHKVVTIKTDAFAQPVFVETPELITNLDAGPHRLSFVKVQCKIEVDHAGDVGKLSAAMPRIVDMIQTYLRETRPEELRSDAGTYRLREALLLRASLAISGVEVRDVLFEELIVQ